MKAERISLTIGEVCTKLGIDYCTVNPHYLEMINDARRLGKLYIELKIIAGDLEAIAERHQLDELKKILVDDIQILEKIDHDLIKIAKRIKND